ncbi:MAG: histidine kinase N-terminal 7TM domain-containing protein, partial [Anaerotignum sp.]
MENYTAIVGLSCLAMVVLSILVFENARFDKATKHRFYQTYLFIVLATLAEWAGVAFNGAPAWTMGIHSAVKCMDYIFTPIAGVSFALQITDTKEQKKHIWVFLLLLGNALFQIVSIFTGWTFYVDGENYYHHGPLYFVYTIIYCIALIDILISFRTYSKNFKRKNRLSIYAIVLFACIGIGLQELGTGNIRTACLAL